MPLSLSSLRDAIGLARLLYAAEVAAGHPDQAVAVAAAGKLLADGHRLGSMEPGSLGHRAAPGNAEKGLAALCAVGWPPDIERLIDVARGRMGVG